MGEPLLLRLAALREGDAEAVAVRDAAGEGEAEGEGVDGGERLAEGEPEMLPAPSAPRFAVGDALRVGEREGEPDSEGEGEVEGVGAPVPRVERVPPARREGVASAEAGEGLPEADPGSKGERVAPPA